MSKLTINIPHDKLEQLQNIAKLTQKSEQELIIEALDRHLSYIDKPKSCYDLAVEIGVIGVAEDLPPDLSTNNDYFSGFGQE